ncbi:MAG TPA: tetratricopeptide repeat protein, partial [Myxococcales bacterium]|nr:tetratricopeptide repeat protein [Myxococcales bacterium]
LGEFRAKVQEIVRPEDVQTHYDLGIAYKEMGLLDEAVGEFELALRHGSGARGADCLTMLGLCEMERGQPAAAIKRLLEGLGMHGLTATARHALQFELGAAYESQGQAAEALDQYQAVAAQDPHFRDVTARIRALGGTASATARPVVKAAAAAGQVTAARGSQAASAAKPRPAPAPSQTPTVAAGGAEPEPGDSARKNRKIGFV